MKNTNYYNRYNNKKSQKYTKLGYFDTVVINGLTVPVKLGMILYPIDLFALVTTKKVWLSDRVYMDLLDCIKYMYLDFYLVHRMPYHNAVVNEAINKQRHELDSVVRTKLNRKSIGIVSMQYKDKVRTYRSLGNETIDKVSKGRKDYSFVKMSDSNITLK
jgi:hypothetical protein